MPAGPKLYLSRYPIPGRDGGACRRGGGRRVGRVAFTDSQNLSMDVFGSLYLAASATSRLELGTAVTNLVTRHPAVTASSFATLHHVSGGRAHIGVGRGDTALELVGIKPPPTGRFEVLLGELQAYLRGDSVDVDGFQSRISWLPVRVNRRSRSTCSVGAARHRCWRQARREITVAVGAEPERIAWAVEQHVRRGGPRVWTRGPRHRGFHRRGCGHRSTGARRARQGEREHLGPLPARRNLVASHSDATVVEEVTSHYDNTTTGSSTPPRRGNPRRFPPSVLRHRLPGPLRRVPVRAGRTGPHPSRSSSAVHARSMPPCANAPTISSPVKSVGGAGGRVAGRPDRLQSIRR